MANADRLIELFSAARTLPPGAERDDFLAAASEGDPELKRKVLGLLRADTQAGDFLRNPFGPQAVLPTEQPGDVIGVYKLRETLGEGGCGVVYVAEQAKPVRRLVALKVIKLGMDTKDVVARFEAERQALAVMDHPSIARVLEAGATNTGRPYFVMELVRGVRITEYCEQNHLPTRERLNLFVQVCHAIQHAHQKGIIHRDIKPSNILVTLHDGVPVPKVIDFGIAKAIEGRLTDATVDTNLHPFVGTPAYMSPEQADLTGLDIDTRTDVYSLGVLLYELLVGCTPFDAKELTARGLDAMRRTIREQEPVRPSTILNQTLRAERAAGAKSGIQNPKSPIDADLDWIVMKCLDKDRQRRYETASGLAADLKRYLANEPVVARPPSTIYRIQKAFRRNKLAYSATAAVTASLVIGLLASLRAIQATERQLYIAKMNLAREAWDKNNLARVRRILDETATAPDRGFEWYYWQRQTHLELKTLRGHLGSVLDVSFSPEGERVLTASYDRTARIWDARSGTPLLKLTGHEGAVTAASWSPDGSRILTASADHTAAIWDAASGQELFRLTGHSGGLTSAQFSPDSEQVVTGSFDGTARVWRVDTGQEVLSLVHGDVIWSVDFSPQGQRIVTGANDQAAIVWEARTGQELVCISASRSQPPPGLVVPKTFNARFSPDGRSIVTTGRHQSATLWDATTGAWLGELKGKMHRLSPRQDDLPLVAEFSPHGERLITGGLDFTATVWGLEGQTNLFTLKGHEAEIVSAAFSSDGQLIVTGSYDHTAKIWNGAATTESLSLNGHTSVVPGAAFSPKGERIVTGGWDGKAIVWKAATGEPLLTLSHGTNTRVWSVAFSPDGSRIATGTRDEDTHGSFWIWDAFTGRELLRMQGHTADVITVEFSQDGRKVLTGAMDGTARVWGAFSGQQLLKLDHNQFSVWATFSPDSRRIATVSSDGDRNTLEKATAAVWDAETGRELIPLKGHLNGFSGVAYAPDGKYIVTGSVDWKAEVWDASTGRIKHTLEGHPGQVIHVAISPDSRRIFTGAFDFTSRVWDAASGAELLALPGEQLVGRPEISPDGRAFIAGPYAPVKVVKAASPQEVEQWRMEQQAAAERIEAERREIAPAGKSH